eukprot:jgi/Psemu1/282557/fgenesh1_pg.9_\
MVMISLTLRTTATVSAFCGVPTHNHLPTTIASGGAGSVAFGAFGKQPANGLLATAGENGGSTERTVDELLERVESKDDENNTENFDEDKVRDLIATLSSDADRYVWDEATPSALFEPLVGYYNVSCTLTSTPNDNPVGGKWTRGLWTVKRTMQHVLPPLPVKRAPQKKNTDGSESAAGAVIVPGDAVSANAVAQVVNAIRLELLWGFVTIWVLLRGDAVPLKTDQIVAAATKHGGDNDDESKTKPKKSPPKLLPDLSDRTVKAYFDRPRIGVSLRGRTKSKPLWKQVLTLGPTSAVVLDTPYADGRIRLGKGGTSGSQFVFRRLSETDEEAREGWKWVLEKTAKAATKRTLLVRVGVAGLASAMLSTILQQRWMKLAARAAALISGISVIGLLRSTGGIETEGDTYMKGRRQNQ